MRGMQILRYDVGSHAIGWDHYFPESREVVSCGDITEVRVPSGFARNIEKYRDFMCRKMRTFCSRRSRRFSSMREALKN